MRGGMLMVALGSWAAGLAPSSACSCVPSSLCRPLHPQPPPRREQQVFLEGKIYNGSGNNGGYGVWPWHNGVTSVVVFGSGNDTERAFDQILCEAHRHGARAILPCGVPRINATDNLSSPAFRRQWVASSIEYMWGGASNPKPRGGGGWDGCNLDIENPDLGARPGLTELVKELKTAMQNRVPGSHLTFDASGDPRTDHARHMVYNYSALAEHVDYFVPCYYDMQTRVACKRRSSGCSLPSPNSPLDAVQAGLEYYLDDLHTDPSTIIMAVPFYGYDVPCRAGGSKSDCRVLPSGSGAGSAPALARQQAGGSMLGAVTVGYGTILNELLPLADSRGVQWNESAASPYFDYPNATTGLRHRVYYDNPRSITAKRELAQRLGLGGVSVWTADALPHSTNPAAAREMWEAIALL